MSRETAFLVLALVICFLAFAVYGLFPDRSEDIKIPNGDRLQADYLQSYSPILELNKTDASGQPAWRKLVFGDNATGTDNSTTSNLTVGMARDIVTLNALASQNKDIDPDMYVSAITDGAAQQISIRDVGQIQISEDISRANLKTYGNNAALVFGVMFGNEQKEIRDVTKYMSSKDAKDLAATIDFQKKVQLLCDSFKKYPAPKSIATLHRSLLERCYYYNDVLTAFGGVAKDPTKALVAVSLYKDMMDSEIDLVSKFSIFFDNSNVVFGASDYGRVFNKKI